MGDIVFHILSGILLASGFFVVSARNPVHAALWLILCFVMASGLMVLIGAELIAMLLVVVYVGAVMVLFLFVLMMLDVDMGAVKQAASGYIVPGLLIALVLCIEILAVGSLINEKALTAINPSPGADTNTQSIGAVLFTRYFLVFQMAGLILLVAQIGAIVLTLRHRKNVKRQNIAAQTARRRSESFEMKDLPPGRGL